MKKHLPTIIIILILLTGLSLLLYPAFSNWWNLRHASQAIAGYSRQVADMDPDRYQAVWEAAWAYNRSLECRSNGYLLTPEQAASYGGLLNIGGTGIMGYVEIPSIGVTLPILHGTGEEVLQKAAGHLEWTSLPVGGPGSHCVISGHRGLPSAKLFTDLDLLTVGDVFMLRVLDEVLTYRVDRILTVEPNETEALLAEPGEDLGTLVPCTPYGITSHRLLLRGRRKETQTQAAAPAEVNATERTQEKSFMLPAAAGALGAALAAGVLILCRRRRRR